MLFHSSFFFFFLIIFHTPPPLLASSHHQNDYLKLHLIHINPFKTPSPSPLLLDRHRILSLHHYHHRNHSIKSPLISGAPTGSGQYFAGISIGTPPQHLLLVADTGSDLTWLTCSPCRGPHCPSTHPVGSTFYPRHSLSFRPTHCHHPTCRLLPHSPCHHPHRRRHSPCWYNYSYSDGSTTSGIFSQETTSFNSTTSTNLIRVPHVSFGCSFHSSGPSVSDSGFEGASGVIGLGRGPTSFTAQLGKKFGNKFSYCLMDYTFSPPPTSYLIIGAAHQNNGPHHHHQIRSTPLLTNQLSPTFYYIGIHSVIIDGVKLPITPSVWALDDLGNGGTVIDSGTTLTYVPEPAYRQILTVMKQRVKLPRLSESTQQFDLCFDTSGVNVNVNVGVNQASFPKMSFELVGDSVFDPPPSNYFIDVAEGITCLALQPVVTPSGFAVIGNIMQQGFLFEFDNDRSLLLFSRNGCGLGGRGGPR